MRRGGRLETRVSFQKQLSLPSMSSQSRPRSIIAKTHFHFKLRKFHSSTGDHLNIRIQQGSRFFLAKKRSSDYKSHTIFGSAALQCAAVTVSPSPNPSSLIQYFAVHSHKWHKTIAWVVNPNRASSQMMMRMVWKWYSKFSNSFNLQKNSAMIYILHPHQKDTNNYNSLTL